MNILNSKLSFVFAAENKATAESFKKLYDNYASGEPAGFADKKLFDENGQLRVNLLVQNVGQNFIADRLLDCLGAIRNKFLTDIGIPNANTDKRERLLTDEVNANNFETASKASVWLETMKKGMETARNLHGLTIDQLNVEWSETPKFATVGGDENGNDFNIGSV